MTELTRLQKDTIVRNIAIQVGVFRSGPNMPITKLVGSTAEASFKQQEDGAIVFFEGMFSNGEQISQVQASGFSVPVNYTDIQKLNRALRSIYTAGLKSFTVQLAKVGHAKIDRFSPLRVFITPDWSAFNETDYTFECRSLLLVD